jgi:TM2 domain-containing membrane protein YozV
MTQPPPEPPDRPEPDWSTPDPSAPPPDATDPYGTPPPGYEQQPGYGAPPPGYQQQPGYPPGYQQPQYGQPAYGQPGYPVQYTDPQAKSKIAAGLLGIFLGGFGVHRFYLGFTKIGIIQIVVTIFTCGIGSLWGFVEGILYLVGANGWTTDATGRPLRE